MAMPPRMLPTATSVCPATDALTTIAISGRFVAIASRISPPSADPRCSRSDSKSVWSESWTPATQIAAAADRKISTSTATGRLDTNSPDLGAGGCHPAVPERSELETRTSRDEHSERPPEEGSSAEGGRSPLRVAADEPEQPRLRVGVGGDRHGRAVLTGVANELLERLHPGQHPGARVGVERLV